PMSLNPARLARLAQAEKVEDLPGAHIGSCFECASCSFVCPSGIPLVQWLRMGKALVAERKKEEG
ncbi:MAG: 4Fe-4S dicluster domain-containing protein, partial [Myxococcota bacterium]